MIKVSSASGRRFRGNQRGVGTHPISIKHYKSIKFVGHGKYENNLLYSFKFYMLIYNDKNAARKGLQKITLYLVSGSWKSVSMSSGMIHD